jgi:hypothetical protein
VNVPAEKIPEDVVEAAQRGLERRTTRIADFRVRDLLAAVFDELDFPLDFFDLPDELDVCRPVEIDDETVRVRGEQPVGEETQAALADVVRAARRRFEAERAAERAEIERQVRAKVAQEIAAEAHRYASEFAQRRLYTESASLNWFADKIATGARS